MKKKIFGGLFILAIAAVAAFNVSMNMQDNQLSALALANVEALAGEIPPTPPIKWLQMTLPCYNSQGYPTGKNRTSCYAGGTQANCTSVSC